MPIGDSKGAFYEDEFRHAAAPWFGTADDNVVSPLEIVPGGVENNEVSPRTMMSNKELDQWEVEPSTGTGIEVSLKKESTYEDWKAKYAPNDSGEDYDLKGAFKAGVVPDANGHMPDTFKLPNHPTFSDESMYAKDHPDQAGYWWGDTFIPPALK